MLQLQIVSDTHIEFLDRKKSIKATSIIKPSAKILALLGDICCVGSDKDFELYKTFINELLPYYEHIIIITGNHEYFYNPDTKGASPKKESTVKGINSKIKKFCKTSDKIHFLSNSTFIYKSGKTIYHILGTTLWSYIPDEQLINIQNSMNDYNYIYVKDKSTKKIRLITSAEVVKMFKKNIKFIQNEITKISSIRDKNYKHEAILLTHHKPYISDKYSVSTVDPAYESDLKHFFKPPIVMWAYGHTHKYDKSIQSNVVLYSNPKGYPRQKTGYKKDEILKLK
jgi:hypothetical protein